MLLKKIPGDDFLLAKMKPDTYEYSEKGLLPIPNSDFVVSRNIFGNVVSRYRDDIHDFSAYNHTQIKSTFDYSVIDRSSLREDVKYLMHVYERFAGSRAKNSNTMSIAMKGSLFRSFLVPLAHFASINNLVKLKELFEDEELLTKFVHKRLKEGSLEFGLKGSAFFHDLIAIGEEKLGFTVCLSDKVQSKLIKLAEDHHNSVDEKTPVIPPLIYYKFINQLWECIVEFEKMQKPFIDMITVMASWEGKKVLETNGGISTKNRNILMGRFLKVPILKKMIDKHNWYTKKVGINKASIRSYITSFQTACKWLIHLYTGMRDTEARNLPYHCLSKELSKGRPAARLLGYTYKYTGNALHGDWVTTSDMERVIDALQAISKVLTKNWPISTAKKTPEGTIRCPLFVSANYLTTDNKFAIKTTNKKKVGISSFKRVYENSIINFDALVITEKDVEFLERLEPEREWRGGMYGVGNVWPMRSHQCRRSLAVYSRQSGLVSIGSTQTQLHHLFRLTSYYYSNNAENCVFDVSDKDHFSKEFTNQSATADYAAFITDILYSNETLYGIKGKQHEVMRQGVKDKSVWVTENRKEMEEKYRKGEISFRDTALGSCESTEACDQFLTVTFIGCIGCDKADLKAKRIDRTLKRHRFYIQTLDPNSIERRYEESEMKTVSDYRETL